MQARLLKKTQQKPEDGSTHWSAHWVMHSRLTLNPQHFAGGEAFIPPRLNRETMAHILGLVRDTAVTQYVVGFSPDAGAKPKKHSVEVALSSKSKGKLVGGKRDGVTY